ncbi:MAG: 3-hydroxybutyrate oligomer hydrolase family protein [Methyloceanibacter sp.]
MTASLQARAGRGRRAVNSVATGNAHYKKRRSPQMASPTTDALTLPLRFRSQRAAFNAATPNRFAFKHAHSHANPENDWARNVLRSIEFAFDLLNEICRAR